MTTITIFANNTRNGKTQIEVSDNTQLKATGISKAKYVGDLNIYMATAKALENIKKTYTCTEVSRW
jgi:hypothetical protein